jgi:hypothetical protein
MTVKNMVSSRKVVASTLVEVRDWLSKQTDEEFSSITSFGVSKHNVYDKETKKYVDKGYVVNIYYDALGGPVGTAVLDDYESI